MLHNTQYQDFVVGQSVNTLESFTLESGKVLQEMPVAYKTWGELNSTASNCIVICHALSGSCDVEDWWQPLLGRGKTFDTSRFFVFCGNVLGSPYGSASPCSIDPATKLPYGPNFPLATIRDDVRAHKAILDQLGVKKVMFAIGGSMGGMQVLEWAFFGKDYVENIVPIATSGRHSAWCISWGEAQRQSIYSDPKYRTRLTYIGNGSYEMSDPPASGLSAARMAAMLTYRSRNSFEARFGRKTMPQKQINISTTEEEAFHNEGNKFRLPLHEPNAEDTEVSVYNAQSYLRYQGTKFINRFDANCYISITRKMDTHDISRGRGEYEQVLTTIAQPCLIIGIASDGLFTVEEQYELGNGIPNSQVVIIESGEGNQVRLIKGHDGFLLEFVQIRSLLGAFIKERLPANFASKVSLDESDIISKPSLFGEAEGDLLLW